MYYTELCIVLLILFFPMDYFVVVLALPLCNFVIVLDYIGGWSFSKDNINFFTDIFCITPFTINVTWFLAIGIWSLKMISTKLFILLVFLFIVVFEIIIIIMRGSHIWYIPR